MASFVAAAGLAATLVGTAAAGPALTADEVPERLIFPIVGPAMWTDDFGDPRPQGSHEGNDVASDWRAPVVAVEPGKVRVYTRSERAGCMLYLYGKSGTTYLYIHLNDDLTPKNDARGGCKPGVAFAPDLRDGDRVRAGQLLGYVGSSGDAGATNHLHFELHPGDGGAVSPFRWLKRAERLLFAPPEQGPEVLAAATQPTLTITGTVKRVELAVGDAPPPDDGGAAPAEPPATEADPLAPPTTTQPPDAGEWPPTAQIPVLIGRAVEATVITVRISSVGLAGGDMWTVERDVTLTVPVDSIVEREKGAKTRKAKLESAEAGERVTVTTGPIELTLASQLARPGTLSAAHVLLRGADA